MVEDKYGPALLRHAFHLGNHLFRIGYHRYHEGCDRVIEGVVIEGHPLRVHLHESHIVESVAFFLTFGLIEHLPSEVDADNLTMPGVQGQRNARSHSHLYNLISLGEARPAYPDPDPRRKKTAENG